MNNEQHFLLLQQQTLQLVLRQQEQLLDMFRGYRPPPTPAILPPATPPAPAPTHDPAPVPTGPANIFAPPQMPQLPQAVHPVEDEEPQKNDPNSVLGPRDYFLDCVEDQPWIPTPAKGKTILEGLDRDVLKAFQYGLRSAEKRNLCGTLRTRKFKCEEPLWLHYFWGRLLPSERKSKGTGRYGVYWAEVASIARFNAIFGDGCAVREFEKSLAFTFLAPRAYAIDKWSSAAEKALQLEKNDFLAIIREVPDSNLVLAYRPCAPNTRVRYEGKEIQGAIGFCPRDKIMYDSYICLQYSPRTRMVTVSFRCWVFNSRGNLMSP